MKESSSGSHIRDGTTERHALFLQGPPCPFFARVARELRSLGWRTTKICLCAGDRLYWHGDRAVSYRGSLAHWPRFLTEFFARESVTDLVLLGEQRSYHKLAIEVAHARSVKVTVTDFGYLRPDWITLERDGMSGNSRFPRALPQITALAGTLPAVDLSPRYRDSSFAMATGDLITSLANVLVFWLYPRYRQTEARAHPLAYFPAMGWRLLSARARDAAARAQVERLLASGQPFFVFPLQLEHDFQILAYSPFRDLLEPLRRVITSFAGHAAPDARLVVKVHPWDPGERDWCRVVRRLGATAGVAGRIDCVDGGPLEALVPRARGLVTVNSTAGLAALHAHCPVKTLGQAVYDVPGVTFQGELDDFWQHARPPGAADVEALVRALAGTVQVRGVFFADPGAAAAIHEVVRRLAHSAVGPPYL